jgi:hypothetical protein
MTPDPNLVTNRDPVVVPAAPPAYDNPRGLPEKWVERYMQRDRAQLAVDVMRVFDGHFKMERSLRRTKLVLGVLNAFLATVAALLALLKFLP